MRLMNWVWAQIDGIGSKIVDSIKYTYRIFLMIYLSLRAALLDEAQGLRQVFSVVSAQIYFTGWQALPLISFLAFASGAVIVLQASLQISFFAGPAMIGSMMVAIVIRELAPLMVALVVTARSGTAVASELGSMKVNREIEALEAMGINPLSYIVFPRIVGGVISTLCLGFYFTAVALITGYVLSRMVHDMPFSFYSESISQALDVGDVYLFILKNSFSGAIIFVVSCYQGLLVKRSPHEVPQVTTKAVLNSIIYVVAFNMAVTTLFYINQLMKLGVI